MTEPNSDYADMRDEHLAQMESWANGARSNINHGPNEPYTPDVVAAMDAQEVVKHAAAAVAYGLLSTQIESTTEHVLTDDVVFDFCQRARDAGYAITAFTNPELRGCDPWDVVDAMVEAGNERIDFLTESDEPDRIEPNTYGRCDTCGATCDSEGCTQDRAHEIALDADGLTK